MKVTSNVKYIPAGVTQYIVDGNDGEINVDTSVSAVTIILPNIINSGYTNTDKGFIINDFSGNAGTNNITLVASNNTVNSQSSVLISVNGGTAKCSIASMNEWFVITEPSTSGMSGTLTANYIPKAASSSTLTNSIIYQDGHNIAIGTTTAVAKLHVLQNTVGTGAKAFSVNFATIGETFYLDDNGYAYYYGGGFTVAGSNAILNLVSNGGVSPSITFKYNNGASTSGFLYGVGASMFFETPAFGLGSSYFNPQARLHIQGVNSTSANFALKVDNSASSPLLYVRNDGNIGIGTSSPSYALDVKGTGIIAQFSDLSVTGAIASLSSKLMFGSTSNHDLSFLTVGSERMTISNSGNVGIGTTSASARLHVKGIDATSANYALKVDNSATTSLLYAKNDGEIGMNGFTIRQLSSTTYFKTSGTGGYMFNNAADSTNLGKITNTGQILFGDISDTNYVGVGIAVKTLSLSSNASKEVFASFFKSNTDQDGLYFSSKQGSVYIQPYAVNSVNQSLILGGRDSGTGVLETLILKSSGVINTPTLPTSNAGLSTGDLYVETAANILANGDKVVGWKV